LRDQERKSVTDPQVQFSSYKSLFSELEIPPS
jgi:hypothetical protein